MFPVVFSKAEEPVPLMRGQAGWMGCVGAEVGVWGWVMLSARSPWGQTLLRQRFVPKPLRSGPTAGRVWLSAGLG